jgi:phospholipid-binding lipoprotein MlaA
LDQYSGVIRIADPLEPLNRATFWINDQIYRYILRPASKAYDTVLPSKVRTGVYNIFDNLEFPIRFVNDNLQFKFKRAGQETQKFLINTTAGVGGIMRVSDRFPSLAEVPPADTGQTFAKWGLSHGFYLVIPVVGPRSLRDTIGLVSDYALYPVTWVTFGAFGGLSGASTYAVSSPDTARTLHGKFSSYDAITSVAVDRYVAVRSAYIQRMQQAAAK